jgi:hypothetical protein
MILAEKINKDEMKFGFDIDPYCRTVRDKCESGRSDRRKIYRYPSAASRSVTS